MGGGGEASMTNETKQNKTLRAFLVNPYIIISALAVLEAIYCFSTNNMWVLRILLVCNIFALFAVSWDLVGGFLGQISLGHALFFGGAAYVSSLLNLHFGIPLIVSMVLGVLSAVIFALILGLPTLRLKGPYLSVVTLVTPMVFIAVIYMYPVELGGDCGFAGFQSLANGDLKTQFIIILAVVLISVLLILKLTNSDFGLILKAIREDDFAAEAAGLNITKYKLMNFIISGVFAGLSGVLFVHFQGAVAPAMLEGTNSILPIMMTMIGGIGTVVGPIIGSYVITFCNEYLIKQPEFRIIIYSVITILILRFSPAGIMGWLKKAFKV